MQQTISDNLEKLERQISRAAEKCGRRRKDITLVAVSKRFPLSAITEAVAAGQKLFGENYVQELRDKAPVSPPEAQFHFIGHLQTNKARHVARHCTMIETLDRPKLVHLLEKHLQELDRSMDGLIQVNLAGEQQKSGTAPTELESFLQSLRGLHRLKIKGLMIIPPWDEDPENSRPYFRQLRQLAEDMAGKGLFHDNTNPALSMGMSNDFPVAIEEGATIIRVGTAIFGQRQY